MVKSDTLQGYIYSADHGVPGTYQIFDALDYYAFYRLLDALCDYTFHGNPAGKAVALGNGSALQTAMPTGLKPLMQTDDPEVRYPEDKYTFPCTAILNPRQAYCPKPSSSNEAPSASYTLKMEPNPTTAQVRVTIPADNRDPQIRVFNFLGQEVLSQGVSGSEITLDLGALSTGNYWVLVGRWIGQICRVE